MLLQWQVNIVFSNIENLKTNMVIQESMAQEIDTAEILRDVVEKESQFKTTNVSKAVDVELDVGSLLVIDTNPVNERSLRFVSIRLFLYWIDIIIMMIIIM